MIIYLQFFHVVVYRRNSWSNENLLRISFYFSIHFVFPFFYFMQEKSDTPKTLFVTHKYLIISTFMNK